jgi:phosphoenolpyruvate carboxykinase (ATP)
MQHVGLVPDSPSLADTGITHGTAHWNLSPEELANISLESGQGVLTRSGAIAVDTGEFTGRAPRDRFIVRDSITEKAVSWSDINIGFEPKRFERLLGKVAAYLNGKEIYVRDSFACANPAYQVNIRVITEYPWSNLFAFNMFLRPKPEERRRFAPEWHIINAPGFRANAPEDGTRQGNFSIIDFSRRIILIGGTGYTGEIKKAMFSVLNFVLPKTKNVLPMHCAANAGGAGDVALFFGLSGTGKTTLSADPERKLIGDDEHGWAPDQTIFNFEGGCYAKVINLSEEREPDIFKAIRPGALLENVSLIKGTSAVDFTNSSKTENSRVSYPIHYITNSLIPSVARGPKNIFFLACDAFGVLPPISRLFGELISYYFMSGYTAKVAGTEANVTEPRMTFSACFGAPFMPLHPSVYGGMLSKKIQEAGASVWLVNTGWSGGPYGTGKRMSLAHTRAMIKAALDGSLDSVAYRKDEIFGVDVPLTCPNVPQELLDPARTWNDPEAYKRKAAFLAAAMQRNYEGLWSLSDDNGMKIAVK